MVYVDLNIEKIIWLIVCEKLKNLMVIIIVYCLGIVSNCDGILLLREGQIVVQGIFDEFIGFQKGL